MEYCTSGDRMIKFQPRKFLKPLALIAACLVLFGTLFELPNIHRVWLRNKVASRVVEVVGAKDSGGGTGFQVQAPSGVTYIVTNSHVCEYALKEAKSKNLLLVKKGDHYMKRRVYEISDKSDLCLIEGWPGMSGLNLGSEVSISDLVMAIGHPLLGPTTMTVGEVTAFTNVEMVHHIMKSNKKTDKMFGASDEPCDQPKNEIRKEQFMLFGVIPLGEVKMCLVKETHSIQTNVVIFPGSSGSPLVDRWGQVVGVVFAADDNSNWGLAVDLAHLREFLADY